MAIRLTKPDDDSAIYVYEIPVRLWHWINALAIIVLAVTGYLIGSPLATVSGEASDHFFMGYVRFAHFAAAYIFLFGFLGRIYWAFAGNEHAKELFLPPIWKLSFWQGVWHEILWYAFIAKEPRTYVGHNPMAVLAMNALFVWPSLFMIITGVALYGEGAGYDSWQYTLFSSWVIPLFGQSQDVHTWHHLMMWVIICFIIMHIYTAVRENIMSRQSIISAMVSGWRTFKEPLKK